MSFNDSQWGDRSNVTHKKKVQCGKRKIVEIEFYDNLISIVR